MLDRDLILLNPDRYNYMGLDEIGTDVWNLPAEVRQLCDEMSRQYRATGDRLRALQRYF
jgi:hypothetical protein